MGVAVLSSHSVLSLFIRKCGGEDVWCSCPSVDISFITFSFESNNSATREALCVPLYVLTHKSISNTDYISLLLSVD